MLSSGDALASGAAGPLQVAVDVTANPLLDLLGSAVGTFITTLLVGAIMIAVVPDYTQGRMAAVLDRPVGTLVYGFVALVLVVILTVALVFSIIGIVVAIPFVLLAYVIWAVGSAVAFLAVGDRLVGHEDGWTKALLVGAGINGLLTLTGIGGIVSLVVGAAGFGAVVDHALS
jgi:hypothetical protein